MLKIAFGGKCGTGKDTAVFFLKNKYGGKQLSFAQPLYEIMHYAQKVCGFKQEKDRKFLQWLGTDWARSKENDVWLRLLRENTPKAKNVYVSDLRFRNEFYALRQDGWTCIKLKRIVEDDRKGTGSHTHKSETDLDIIPDHSWDAVIENNGTIKEFEEKIDEVINDLYKHKT